MKHQVLSLYMYNCIIKSDICFTYILELFAFQTSSIETVNLIWYVESIKISNRWK